MTKCTLALDIGTSSCRCAAITADGVIHIKKTVSIQPYRPQIGISEYNATDLLNASTHVLHQVLDSLNGMEAVSLAVSSQRSTVVFWEKSSGRVLGPVLTWEDGRAVQEAAMADISQEEIHALTGLYKTPYFSAPKIAWMLSHCEEIKKAVARKELCVAPVASFFIFHLTKGRVFATDPTLAQRMLLFDIHKGTWNQKLCQAFSIPVHILPVIKSTLDDYGAYHYDEVDLPIRVCCADQQAASSALQPGDTCINYGTGAFVLRHVGEIPVLLPGLLTSVAPSVSGKKLRYILEGPVNAAGSAYLWLEKQGVPVDMEHLDEICSQAKHPLQILPAIGGLGAPYWNFMIKPVVNGQTAHTQPADWIAGLTRALACLITDVIQYMQANGVAVNSPIGVSGGLSRSAYLLQFQADLLQKILTISSDPEETLLGLARISWGTNVMKRKVEKTFSPHLSKTKSSKLYQQWQQFVNLNVTQKTLGN